MQADSLARGAMMRNVDSSLIVLATRAGVVLCAGGVGYMIAVQSGVVLWLTVVTVLALAIAFGLRILGNRLWTPPVLVAIAYGFVVVVGYLGTGSPLQMKSLGSAVAWLNGAAVACFIGGWLIGRVAFGHKAMPLRSSSEATIRGYVIWARVLIVLASIGAAYRFRNGIPLFSDVQEARFIAPSSKIAAVAALAYASSFLAFLLLLPAMLGRWSLKPRPWLEMTAVTAVIAIEGNRRFTILFICLVLFATWANIRLPPVRTFLLTMFVLAAFALVGQLRAEGTSAQASRERSFLSNIHYHGPTWLSPGYLALRLSDEIVARVWREPALRSDPTRPRPMTLAGPKSLIPHSGHELSPDFWLRQAVAPESDQRSGLAVPLVASLLLDGGPLLVVVGFLALGLIAAWCKSKACSPAFALLGVAVVSSTVLGIYGVFLGTPHYTIAIVGLLFVVLIQGASRTVRRNALGA